ncbi:MAG: hypothetical protein K2X86_13540, partial [Cytophagaceae bacterium]|nr:hypothetical protein [Cytophagaceae bacterium]
MKKFFIKIALLTIAFGALYFMSIQKANGATFIVDNKADTDNMLAYVAGDGNNTLRKCIRLANAAAGLDNINF